MKLLFTTDFHGSEGHYTRLLVVTKEYRPDVVVLGGDMFPDDSALHPEEMGVGQPEYIRHQFRAQMHKLREASGVGDILVIFGNHDWGSSAAAMKELAAEKLVTVLELSPAVKAGGLWFIGYSCSPPTPWYVKDFERLDVPGDKPPLLGGARWDQRFNRPSPQSATVLFGGRPTMMEELAGLKPPQGPWVFVAHSPPYDTKLDRSDCREPWGSKAVRQAIEKHQPVLSLHGHIHESPSVTGSFRDQIGRTIAVNPGQSPAQLDYACIEIDESQGQVRQLEVRKQA